jgi:mannose-1-phosphate guanylyltransferase/mannose-6-phosphate isomerase
VSQRIIPAILSGGAGTRLWPLSTQERPKQFHTLGGGETLIASTIRRVSGDHSGLAYGAPLILCNTRYEALVREHAPASSTIVLEPEPRNTAAAAAIAAALSHDRDADALVLLLPSDHLVRDEAAFHAVVARAAPFAQDRIVTFGITPDRPATGYGYIKRGEALGDGVFAIDAFKEKPDTATAQSYLASGAFSWNAGIFLFRPEVLLAEFEASADIRDTALASLRNAKRSGDVIGLDAEAFSQVRSSPLDIAVMEKTERGAVTPCDIGWADIGTWDEVWRLAPRAADGFAWLGPAAAADASKISESGVKVAVLEGEDLIVVAAPKGLLILPRAHANDASARTRLAASL